MGHTACSCRRPTPCYPRHMAAARLGGHTAAGRRRAAPQRRGRPHAVLPKPAGVHARPQHHALAAAQLRHASGRGVSAAAAASSSCAGEPPQRHPAGEQRRQEQQRSSAERRVSEAAGRRHAAAAERGRAAGAVQRLGAPDGGRAHAAGAVLGGGQALWLLFVACLLSRLQAGCTLRPALPLPLPQHRCHSIAHTLPAPASLKALVSDLVSGMAAALEADVMVGVHGANLANGLCVGAPGKGMRGSS